MKTMVTIILSLLITVSFANATANYYGVWQDMNDDGVKDTFLGSVSTFNEGTDVVTAYDYYSASSHMSNPSPEAYTSKIWLYDDYYDESVVDLGMFHDIDGGGSPDNVVKWNIFVEGSKHKKIFSDDGNELRLSNNNPNKYLGRWHYWHNTDGGIIALKYSSNWEVKIVPKVFGDIKEWQISSSDGNNIVLDKAHSVFITNDIPEDVPEFGTVASILVLAGAGLFLFIRRKNN